MGDPVTAAAAAGGAGAATAGAGGAASWLSVGTILSLPEMVVNSVFYAIRFVLVVIPAFVMSYVAMAWTVFELYGWHLVFAAVGCAIAWQYLGASIRSFYERATALPPVQADAEAVLRARQKQQDRAKEVSQKDKEYEEARRRAVALGEEKPLRQTNPEPVVRRHYGGGSNGGDACFRRGARRDMRRGGGGGG
eukprot:m.23171 g.23171  ORF g.23171 m.23171 type:complete len:193 (+) comp7087_c0_seq1:2010-2588(+)